MSPTNSVTSVLVEDRIKLPSKSGVFVAEEESALDLETSPSFSYPPKASTNPSSRIWMQKDLHDHEGGVTSAGVPHMSGHAQTRRFSSRSVRPANLLGSGKTEGTPPLERGGRLERGTRIVDSDGASIIIPSLRYTGSTRPPSNHSSAITATYKRRALIHFVALCWCLFIEGWNDGTTGPLLPVIQRDFQVGFAVVSMLFVSNCIGFITGAISNVWLNDRFGFGKVIVLGAVCQLCTYVIQAPRPPFPLMVLANGLAGFGLSLQNSQANGFVGVLKGNVPLKLGLLHASYGLGAFASPLVSTQFSELPHWSYHYIISAVMALSNVITLSVVFRFRTQDEVLASQGIEPGEVTVQRENTFRQIIRFKSVHFLAIFALIYIGVEVTLGGWIVTFIINERDGGPSAGYISSGFFGGLTLGRVGLLWLNKLIGERRVIFVYTLLAIGLEVTIWVVPSIIQNALAVSFIGVLLGPMFPIIVSHASHIFPRWLLTACVGWITGIGMAGSAALPFFTGLLASRYGIGSLQPLMISMMCTMVGVWALVPPGQRRVD
ncbi:hypothetical protein ONZ45_g19482 [Pleurotus djamor]|nr:hypothetical protein ONZ45_g19482 [Pleurotus djamor]